MSLAATQVDLVRVLGDLANNIAHGGPKKRGYDEDSADSVDTVVRPEGQASLFSLGVKTLPKKPAKRRKLAMPLGTRMDIASAPCNNCFFGIVWMLLYLAMDNQSCICFRGTSTRILEHEQAQYHKDVIVMWQKKAWYDVATCKRWIGQSAMQEGSKADLGRGERHLILCDNLAGQTRKSNVGFMKLLAQHCDADVL